jgi:hypothetical protein
MVTRRSLTLLTGITLALLAIAGIIGQHHHGALKIIANIGWWGFVICALVLILTSAATIRRHRSRSSRSSPPSNP